jgi:hypothetical protein
MDIPNGNELDQLPEEEVEEELPHMDEGDPGDDDDNDRQEIYENLLTICNAIYGTDFKGIDIAGAVLLTSILRDHPRMYKKYIQERGDNFLEIMESDELLSQMIAAQSCGATSINTEESDVFDPIISGRSPRAIDEDNEHIDHDPIEAAQVYTNLIQFVSSIRLNMENLCDLMLELIYQIQRQILLVIPVAAARTARVYDNIDLVRSYGAQQIFPKFSLNIVCEKDPLLQTVLVAGRENGMGKVLNTFIFGILQTQHFFRDYGIILKIVEPTESNRLWQVKISVNNNDFGFLTLQILNLKPEFFTQVAQITPNPQPIERNQDAAGIVRFLRADSSQLFENLCSLLYMKATSKDFNCLCSLSELDVKIYQLIFEQIRLRNLRQVDLFAFIQLFLTNLVDAQINVKKKYFIYGLLNLMYCSRQEDYTIETKVYRWLFDQPLPRLTVFPEHSQENKNVFLYSMRLIERVNILCRNRIRIVMGGGKQYSLFQKALFRFKLANTGLFDSCMLEVVNSILRFNPIPPDPPPNPANPADHVPDIRYPTRDTLLDNLNHRIVKAAADLDAGIYHERGALGSTQCMTVCMLLQVCFKKLIDHLIRQGGEYVDYEVDIGNSCIGNPPTTLSSLRINLNNSYLFYSNLEGVDIRALMRNIGDIGIQLGSQPDRNISSTICPFDLVPKGLMEDYVEHILEAVLLFGGMREMQPLTQGEKIALAQFIGNNCMTTQQGFSSALKGIFDIFYTLFIIENFTNRTLVTQKINKELKRISICAQILYLHYSELIGMIADSEAIIRPMLDILRDMISYGYAGNLLNPRHFNIIMQKYVEFIRKLIEFNRFPPAQSLQLNFYCLDINILPNIQRGLTRTELFFMNLLENSLDLPEFPGDPPHPPPPFPAAPQPPIPAEQRLFPRIVRVRQNVNFLRSIPHNVFFGLNCIRPAMIAVNNMDPETLTRLSQNKIYASYRDTENKSNSIVVISIAYQNFLWNIAKRDLIQVGNVIDPAYDSSMFLVDPANPNSRSIGLLDVFTSNHPKFFDNLMQAIAPCYANIAENLLDISDDKFDDIRIDDTRKFQFMFWFITCIFGIKTKSATKKIISLARTYLNGIREAIDARMDMSQIFGCNIEFPAQPEPRLARVELEGQHLEPNDIPVNFHPDDALYLAYDMHTIYFALRIYRGVEANFRQDPENFVFIIRNTLVVLKNSKVLRKDLMERLTVAFSKLPRGQAYVDESYAYMSPILGDLRNIIVEFCGRIRGDPQQQQLPQQLRIENFLERVRHDIPNLLTVNPYRPPAHDVSKFVDFEENPQYYRNKWISYFIDEIFNSDVNTVNLFNHMKLFILMFRYLTMLSTNDIDGILIVLGPQYTKPFALQQLLDDRGLIAINHRCELVLPELATPDVIGAAEVAAIEAVAAAEAVTAAAVEARVAVAAPRRKGRRGSRNTAPVVAGADADEGMAPPPPPPLPPRQRGRRILPTPAAAATASIASTAAAVTASTAAAASVTASAAQPSPSGRSGRSGRPLEVFVPFPPNQAIRDEIEPPPPRRRATGRATRQNRGQGGGTKINNHTRKNKYKYPNKVKVKIKKLNNSNKSKKRKMKSKYKKSNVNVTFKRRRQRKSHK